VSTPPTTVSGIYTDLETFGFSFLILITMWLRYTRVMSALPLESRRIVNMNIMLLFAVSIEPFLFNIVRHTPVGLAPGGPYDDATSTLYALDLGGMFAILGGFSLALASEDSKLIPKELISQYKVEGITWFACGLIFVLTAIPVFFTIDYDGTAIRYYLWIVPIAILWLTSRRLRKIGYKDN
jgi:uncharacterized membrane protein